MEKIKITEKDILEKISQRKRDIQNEIDNHLHYLKGFYVKKIDSQLLISSINIKKDESIKDRIIELKLPKKIEIDSEIKSQIINQIDEYLSSKEIHFDERINTEINLKNIKKVKITVIFSILKIINDEKIKIYNQKLSYYNKLKDESGSNIYDYKIQKYTHKKATIGGYYCHLNDDENRDFNKKIVHIWSEPAISSVENSAEDIILDNLNNRPYHEISIIYNLLNRIPDISGNFPEEECEYFVRNLYIYYIFKKKGKEYFETVLIPQLQENGILINEIDNIKESIGKKITALKSCNYHNIINIFRSYIKEGKTIDGMTRDNLLIIVQPQVVSERYDHIKTHLTDDTFNNNTWRLEILKSHVHKLFLAHNGFEDINCGTIILDELNFNNNNIERYFGYQIIHSYLHILDEIPILNPDAHLVDDKKDTRWCIIIDQLYRMRKAFSPSLYKCIERILNYNRNSVFEKDPSGKLYNTPYLLVEGAYAQKYRQLHTHDISYINSDFRHATHTLNAPFKAPEAGQSIGDHFPNDDKIDEINL